MGRGGAQLGKAVKGKSKDRKKDKKRGGSAGGASGAGGAGGAGGLSHSPYSLASDAKMLEEYERLANAAEAQRQRMKKTALAEAQYSRSNRRALQMMYRRILTNEKVDSLRKEMEILAQNHARDVARKQQIIFNLKNELTSAEFQMMNAVRIHMHNLHRLVSLHNQMLHTVSREYAQAVLVLKQDFLSERNMLENRHERDVRAVNAVIASVEASAREIDAEFAQRHETDREELRNKNLESMNELRLTLESKMEDLERQFDEAHRMYLDQTQAANTHFQQLKAEDAQLALSIYEKKKKIARMQSAVASWRKKIALNAREGERRNDAMRRAKLDMDAHCLQLKQKMNRFRKNEAQRLTQLTIMARKAAKLNQEYVHQAEQIIAQAELARKLETEREKVLPFFEPPAVTVANSEIEAQLMQLPRVDRSANSADPSAGPNQDDGDATSIASTAAQSTAAAAVAAAVALSKANGAVSSFDATFTGVRPDGANVGEWAHLNRFFAKFNKVLLDKHGIETEKRRLETENRELRSILQQFLDGIIITPNSVDSSNPLLIVNGKLPLLPAQSTAIVPVQQQQQQTLTAATLRRSQAIVPAEQQLNAPQYVELPNS